MSVDLQADAVEGRLIEDALAGDGEAFADLFRIHYASAMRVAMSFVRSNADAEDVVQESFVKAWRAIDGFKPGSPFGPWLKAIVANEARSRIRADGRRASAHGRLEEHVRRTSDPVPSAEALFLRRDTRDGLDRALGELDPADERVVRLRYFLGLSESEMAVELAVPAGTVKSRLSRAMVRLREHVAILVVALLGLTMAVAIAVPPVRAAIERILGITGAEKVISVPRLPEHLSSRPFDWGPVVDPEDIGDANPFGSGLPRFHGTEPEVRLRSDLGRPMLTLVYGDDTATIVEGAGPLILAKLVPVGIDVRPVRVEGGQGLWIPGGLSHALAVLDPESGYVQGPKTRIDAGVLALRAPDGRDYRIQTRGGLGHALELARTLYSRTIRHSG